MVLGHVGSLCLIGPRHGTHAHVHRIGVGRNHVVLIRLERRVEICVDVLGHPPDNQLPRHGHGFGHGGIVEPEVGRPQRTVRGVQVDLPHHLLVVARGSGLRQFLDACLVRVTGAASLLDGLNLFLCGLCHLLEAHPLIVEGRQHVRQEAFNVPTGLKPVRSQRILVARHWPDPQWCVNLLLKEVIDRPLAHGLTADDGLRREVPLTDDVGIHAGHVERHDPIVLANQRVFDVRARVLRCLRLGLARGNLLAHRPEPMVNHDVPQANLLERVCEVCLGAIGQCAHQFDELQLGVKLVYQLHVHHVVLDELLVVLAIQSIQRMHLSVRDLALAKLHMRDVV